MKKPINLLFLFLYVANIAFAQREVVVNKSDGTIRKLFVSDIDDIRFSGNSSVFYMNNDAPKLSIPFAEIDSLTFDYYIDNSNDPEAVYVQYSTSGVNIINPYESTGVSVTTDGSHVSVTAATGISGIHYHLSGTTSDGSFSINSDTDITIALDKLQMTSLSSPVINISKAVTATFLLNNANHLADDANNGKNNALAGKGNLIFEGDGSLVLQAHKKNGISSDMTLTIHSGDIQITAKADDGKAMKAVEDITIQGGNIIISVSGDQSKAISGDSNTYIKGGNINITASGTTVLESAGSGYDPSYCSAIKSDGDISVSGGALTIDLPNSNKGGKGLSADGNISISGGTIHITTAGDGATYTNENGATDSYTSACIKSDVDIAILGGTIYCSSSGKGGKGISADGTLVLGQEGQADSGLFLEVKTSGERFYVSGSTGGGGGGGWPPGGGNQDNADYANPKAIKSEGNLTINSGVINIYCTQSDEGGEGLESKATLTINGGNIHVEAHDDCINAANHIQIDGGSVYCQSSGNDAIDSNGTITIAGGQTIAHGSRSPEGGFDCDNSTFKILGGIVIGTGGNTSTPSSSASTQYGIIYNNASAGSKIALKDANDNYLLLFELPTFSGSSGGGWGNSMTVLFSDPGLDKGTYTLQYGGSISGGTTVDGYNTGGTYSGGSTKSVTISNNRIVTVR